MRISCPSLLGFAVGVFAIPSQDTAGTLSEQICDFESPSLFDTTSNAGILGKPIYYGYCGLNWTNLDSARRVAVGQPLNPRGAGFAIALKTDGTSFLSTTPSTINGINPLAVYVGLFLGVISGEVPAVRGNVLVTPESPNVAYSPPSKACPFTPQALTSGQMLALINSNTIRPGLITGPLASTYAILGLTDPFLTVLSGVFLNEFGIGSGNVTKCDLPSSWKKVEKVSFKPMQSTPFDLSQLQQATGLVAGQTLAAIDDFKYVFRTS